MLSCFASALIEAHHQIYGPKGVGAIYLRRRPRVRLEPIINGGGQERGLRSGTVPTPLVVSRRAFRVAGPYAHYLSLRRLASERRATSRAWSWRVTRRT